MRVTGLVFIAIAIWNMIGNDHAGAWANIVIANIWFVGSILREERR